MMTQDQGITYVLVSTTSRDSPFSRKGQNIISSVIQKAHNSMKEKFPDSNLKTTGVFKFAKETSDNMERRDLLDQFGFDLGHSFVDDIYFLFIQSTFIEPVIHFYGNPICFRSFPCSILLKSISLLLFSVQA